MEPEKVLLRATLSLLRQDGHVILPIKKLKIGAGLRNGYGGGIDEGEDPLTTTVRETSEECGITLAAADVTPAAVVDFHNITMAGEAFTCRVFVSLIDRWGGDPHETNEMGPPERFPLAHPPLSEMMLADRDWLPPVLAGRTIYAEAWYAPRQAALRQPTRITDISQEHLDRLWK